jgi:two-component system LytT family response regulator
MNPIWTTILVDDSPSDLQSLKRLLLEHCPQAKVRAEVSDAEQALAAIRQLKANLVFCSCRLGNGNAFEMLDHLKDFDGHLVFVSEDESFAMTAIRHNALGYLLKPVSAPPLLEVMARLDQRASTEVTKPEVRSKSEPKKKFGALILNSAGVQHIVQIPDIIHIQGDGNYATLHIAAGEKILVSKPLKHFEDILPAKSFFRTHQSHMVNIENVRSVHNGDVQSIHLSNGHAVPLARRKKDMFMSWLARM